MRKFALISLCLLLGIHLFPVVPQLQAQWLPQQRNLSVSAVVPPAASAFHLGISYQGPTVISQGQPVTYEVTYGASASAAVNTENTIVVNYSRDLNPNNGYVIDYVSGSASKGYGNVSPVVDTFNRTITWRLASLPPGIMYQKLTFQLRTNYGYREPQAVPFTSTATMSNEYITVPTQSVQQEYLFDPNGLIPESTVTSSPQSTITQTGSPSSFSTPTPTPTPIQFSNISIDTVTASQAAITTRANKPMTAEVRYGTSPTALTQTVRSQSKFLQSHTMKLSSLLANTQYFFQVTITDNENKSKTSEIFTFKSASGAPQTTGNQDAFSITSNNVVLLSKVLINNEARTFDVPLGSPLRFSYTLADNPTVKQLELLLINADGVTSRMQFRSANSQTLIIDTKTPAQGSYRLQVQLTDTRGNIITRDIARMRVSNGFAVINKNTGEAISDARLVLWYYNTQTHQFEKLTRIQESTVPSPLYSNAQGYLPLVLPEGKYRVDVSAFGYQNQSAEFSLGQDSVQGYPTIAIDSSMLNPTQVVELIADVTKDTGTKIQVLAANIFTSARVFNTIATGSLGGFSLLGSLLFSFRTQIRMQEIAPFFFFHILRTINKHKAVFLSGIVRDEEGKPLSKVLINVIDPATSQVLGHTMTNLSGQFHIKNTFPKAVVSLLYSKDGYATLMEHVETNSIQDTHVTLSNHAKHHKPFLHGIEHIAGSFFEVSLLAALIFELIAFVAFGFAKTLPFFALSVCNILMWMFFLKEKGRY